MREREREREREYLLELWVESLRSKEEREKIFARTMSRVAKE